MFNFIQLNKKLFSIFLAFRTHLAVTLLIIFGTNMSSQKPQWDVRGPNSLAPNLKGFNFLLKLHYILLY